MMRARSSADIGQARRPPISSENAPLIKDYITNHSSSTEKELGSVGIDVENDGGNGEGSDTSSSDGSTDQSKQKQPKKNNISLSARVRLFSIFMVSGPMLIMSNKYILKDLDFSFPLTLTFITLCFCSTSCWVYVTAMGLDLDRARSMITRKFFASRICPIGALSAGTVVFGMTSYLFLTVSFIQMLKAFTPVMAMLGLVLFRLEGPSRRVVACVLIICLGTAIAGYGELHFSLVGVSFMLLAQSFEALKLIFTQVVLQKNKFSLVETLYYVTPTSAAFVFFLACLLEFPKMTQADVNKVVSNMYPFILSCVVAIMTNVINTFVVQHSNALVLKLAVTARNALLVFFNAALMGEAVTTLEVLGYAVSLSGFLGYNIVKLQEKQPQTQEKIQDKR